MTASDVLQLAKNAGIVLEADGDQLVVDAPLGALTPKLRDLLAQHKPELLATLAPVLEFVHLQSGLTVPLPSFLLAFDLERRGFRLATDRDHQFTIEPTGTSGPLTAQDRAGIRRWHAHLGAIIDYVYPVA
jgi:pyochelin synthetase